VAELFWHCSCGDHGPVEGGEYEHGDREKCDICYGWRFVVTLEEGARAEQLACFGGRPAALAALEMATAAAKANRRAKESRSDDSRPASGQGGA